jgi:hypothetical protein
MWINNKNLYTAYINNMWTELMQKHLYYEKTVLSSWEINVKVSDYFSSDWNR